MKDENKSIVDCENEIKEINAQIDELTMRKAKLLFTIKELGGNMRNLLRLTPKDGGGIS